MLLLDCAWTKRQSEHRPSDHAACASRKLKVELSSQVREPDPDPQPELPEAKPDLSLPRFADSDHQPGPRHADPGPDGRRPVRGPSVFRRNASNINAIFMPHFPDSRHLKGLRNLRHSLLRKSQTNCDTFGTGSSFVKWV